MNDVTLLETLHPDDTGAGAAFESLVGIDDTKQALLDELRALLDTERIAAWEKKHHKKGIALSKRWRKSTPLVLLSGEVGCGKSALAASVGTPLANALDRRVVTLETPSDLRGLGHVGEMSARITDAFDQARRKAKEIGTGLLVIDEADDVATARAQNQAHHEDRAGLNVLIKQLDQVARAKVPLAIILITNRHTVLDPAVRRRAALHLHFERPNVKSRRAVFAELLAGVPSTGADLDALAAASERPVPFSYSDLVDRLARAVLRDAQRRDEPVSVALVHECLRTLEPSPLMAQHPERGL